MVTCQNHPLDRSLLTGVGVGGGQGEIWGGNSVTSPNMKLVVKEMHSHSLNRDAMTDGCAFFSVLISLSSSVSLWEDVCV